jgi:hypothetical protein
MKIGNGAANDKALQGRLRFLKIRSTVPLGRIRFWMPDPQLKQRAIVKKRLRRSNVFKDILPAVHPGAGHKFTDGRGDLNHYNFRDRPKTCPISVHIFIACSAQKIAVHLSNQNYVNAFGRFLVGLRGKIK